MINPITRSLPWLPLLQATLEVIEFALNIFRFVVLRSVPPLFFHPPDEPIGGACNQYQTDQPEEQSPEQAMHAYP